MGILLPKEYHFSLCAHDTSSTIVFIVLRIVWCVSLSLAINCIWRADAESYFVCFSSS